MSFASDQLYDKYLRRNMPTIVSKVKVREIMIHLPCLTAHDRETIEAKRETCGNYDGMVLLLDCLKRRENWPEQFIAALEACEQRTLAAEIRAEYNSLRGINNPSPPPANVVRAHVHPAPSAHSQAAEASASASPYVETPAQPQAPQSPAVPKAASPPEPVPEPPQSAEAAAAPLPSTPPPSPAVHHPQVTTPPAPQKEINAQQEPEENSESDSAATPERSRPAEKCETDAPCQTGSLQTTSIIEVRPPRSPSSTQIDSDVTDGSSYRMPTPEKRPVQDTMPHGDKTLADVLQPEETSEPPTRQVIESRPQTETTASASAPPAAAAGINFTLHDDEISVCLSKPGQLVSIQPQNPASPTIPAPDSPAAPYSGNSERLQFSDSAPDTVISVHVPACSAVVSNAANSVSALENGIDHNEPEENHYESPCQSLDMQDVQVNVGHVAEEPSILNLDGQISAPQVNGEAARAPSTITADTVSSLNHHPSAPVPADTAPEHSGENTAPPSNTKYILTAAGVGACALLVAWRFKN